MSRLPAQSTRHRKTPGATMGESIITQLFPEGHSQSLELTGWISGDPVHFPIEGFTQVVPSGSAQREMSFGGTVLSGAHGTSGDVSHHYTFIQRDDGEILQQLIELKELFMELKSVRANGFVAPMTTLNEPGLRLVQHIPVVIQTTDEDSYVATFFDANIGISGDTPEEAFANLRALIADIFEELENDKHRLGPATTVQLAVLRQFIREKV